MSSERKHSRPLVLCRLVLPLALALTVALKNGVATQEYCTDDKLIGLSLAYSVNSTGHPELEARLMQPSESQAWQMKVDLGTTKCESSPTSLTVLKMTLNGSPVKKPVKPLPPGYTFLPGLGRYKRPAVALDWTAARDFCNNEGTSLTVPKTQDEINQLINKFGLNAQDSQNTNCVWIGVSDLREKGKFATLTGEPLENETAIPWKESQPSGLVNERCVDYCVGGGLYDDACSLKYAFFCS